MYEDPVVVFEFHARPLRGHVVKQIGVKPFLMQIWHRDSNALLVQIPVESMIVGMREALRFLESLNVDVSERITLLPATPGRQSGQGGDGAIE